MKNVTLIADGACKKNPGPGGWATILRYGKHEKIIVGGESHTTNNRMELVGVIEGFKALKDVCAVTVLTDSQYVINPFEKKWLEKWKTNGWMTNAGPVKNQDLWMQLMLLVEAHTVKWQWVKGHSGHPDNERVDALASQEAESRRSIA